MEISTAQRLVWQNKLAKGFNTTDVAKEFMFLVEEVGEAHGAYRKEKPDFGEELADVAAFLFGVAEMTGVDLDREVQAKIEKNTQREYRTLRNGTRVKDDSRPDAGIREQPQRQA